LDSRKKTMSPTLNYPFEREPQTGDGSAVEIAPGVLWLRMPLFASLPWINVWAIAEDGGWSIVDTGLHSAKSIDAWQAAFVGALGGAPVLRVVVTHMHPDHCGMAGWIAERFKTQLWIY
jgi:glyoxylase-like metal-dependent hydrolase (beta-lactamase superfamily II)